jgi:hypothetical protein
MEPLSDDDSQRLFYKRIFYHESRCPLEFEVLSEDILKKCGGVPLAIITIANLLASDQQVKPVGEWRVLLKSIGRGLTEDPSVDEMLRILSFSYYDLPSHLKTCLLYLSMFPEDYQIGKDRLIWMWIAENFVRCDKDEDCAFEIGETYLNELVNRNMIMLAYDDGGTCCRVHDMVLDLICSLSSEENFVTVLNGTRDALPSRCNVRRLSLQNARKGELQTMPLPSMSMSQVRSVAAFEPAIDLMPPFSRFVVLRVLDLTDCDLSNHDHLNLRGLGSLLHLRYLSLARTKNSKLSEEVGNLEFLQVLDLSYNDDMELPLTIIKLRRLMCLLIQYDHKRLPGRLGNLTSLEVLDRICCVSPSTAKELGCMKRLRKLVIEFNDMSLELEEAFVESLGKLTNIQSIEISDMVCQLMDIWGERWVAPPTLQELIMSGYLTFYLLPAWISPHLSQLCDLQISVVELDQEDIDILGSLPRLGRLNLSACRPSRLLLVGAVGFPGLRIWELSSSSPGQVVFQPGALPKAERVWIDINLQVVHAKAEAAGISGDCFRLGIGNHPSLCYVQVTIHRSGVTVGEAKHAKASLENALRAHSNRPVFNIYFKPTIPQGT